MNGIYINSLSFAYPNGVEALKGINLKIEPGEIVGIMGRNGAGKSTFMHLINGLLTPTMGTVFVDGIATTNYKSTKLTKKVGVMMQNPDHQLFSGTVEEEIDFSLKNLNLSNEDYNMYKESIITKLRLEKFLDKSPFNLSGGERKRISVASILCRQPEYILFDEPTVGQDKNQRLILENIIINEAKSKKTIIIITHDTEFIYKITNRIIIFNNGRIIADGPTKKILSNKKILAKSSLIEPRFIKLKNMLTESWKKNENSELPLNLSNINDFNSFREILMKKMEGQ